MAFFPEMTQEEFKTISLRLRKEEHQSLTLMAKKKNSGNKAGYVLGLIAQDRELYSSPLVSCAKNFSAAYAETIEDWCFRKKADQADLCYQLIRKLAREIKTTPDLEPNEVLGEETYHYPLISWEEVTDWKDTPRKREIGAGKKWAVTSNKLSNEGFALVGRPELAPMFDDDKYIFCDIFKNIDQDAWLLAKTPKGDLSVAHLIIEGGVQKISFSPFNEFKGITMSYDYTLWEIIETRKI